ncbi:peptide chain release factor N(5)-glutamine methyltransferase [Lentilactobacillus laojiaonis]|uniref:peptide chain release factor N(5)-glutamine methyltransferase n=1 Tax=Lentilactobacillus laojiaonis TaxID=2883998 RepID=UPI001D0B8A95|nr:peptide chain release factor N(5)-glutamine methyltransferase [Lentilactobacillus laojiaonis]UDM31765.1 peptide chain release factor N(5)-glutamine methyltransferase [Lentilactobacillus laojiaonis]
MNTNMNIPTYFEARNWASLLTKNIEEIDRYDIDLLITKRQSISTTELLLRNHKIMKLADWNQFKTDVEKLITGYPVQYIVNKADFYGNEFYVNEDVLIPRNETEELIDAILDDFPINGEPLRVLDIGTGSGAIAVTLKKYRPNWQLVASDISSAALRVAKNNADNNQVDVKFVLSDLFNNIDGKFDLIVSNPPYISANEKNVMDKKVLEYEPTLALFAANNGLKIYQSIADEANEYLNNRASLYLEIGYKQGPAVQRLFQDKFPNSKVEIKQDITGNDRMIRLKR